MPGQYREFASWLGAKGTHEIVFLTQRRNNPKIGGVRTVQYAPHHKPAQDAFGLSKVWEEATGAGFGAASAARKLDDEGFRPDIIIGHTGWGEMLFLKQIWPDVPILGLFEYFYRATGGPVGFDPEEPVNAHAPFLLEARNAVHKHEGTLLRHCRTARQTDDIYRRLCIPRKARLDIIYRRIIARPCF